MKSISVRLFLLFWLITSPALRAAELPIYRSETNIVYSIVGQTALTLNAFLPEGQTAPTPAIMDIHGGWLFAGGKASQVDHVGGWQWFERHGLAVFSIDYRLGQEGAFPQNIRDCRNAIRFIRKNAERFHIDPDRIAVTGGSAGGYLSLMVAMVPEDFPDGGPLPGLENVSARVNGCFSFIAPTDFVRFWNQGPGDDITNSNGKISFRGWDDKIPDDSRPRLRILFRGVTPDSETGQALYNSMSPIGHVRKDLPPLLICDGEKDPIVPGLHGKVLFEKLQAAGADATYWMTPGGDHSFPGGAGFDQVLDKFLVRSLKLDLPQNEK